MQITTQNRIELGELVYFISEKKGLTYEEAERLIPAIYFEGCCICDDQGDEDWCKEVVAYLIENNIDAVEVCQE